MELSQEQQVLPTIIQGLPLPILHQLVLGALTNQQPQGQALTPTVAVAPSIVPQSAAPLSCGDYEDLVVQVLRESEAKGWTYRRSLESLNMQYNIPAIQWKDFYLEHAQRLNKQIELPRAKKPVFYETEVNEPQSTASSSRSGQSPSIQQRTDAQVGYRRPSGAQPPTVERQVRPSDHEPLTPRSRSPTPPREVEKIRDGYHRFTEEDDLFLIRYARYRLAQDPSVSVNTICQELGDKAPHHNSTSWRVHWTSKYIEFNERINGSAAPTVLRTHEDMAERLFRTDPGVEVDEGNMSTKSQLNEHDKRQMAKHIACFYRKWWPKLTKHEQWDDFAARYPKCNRTYRAWADAYQRNSALLDLLAAKYRAETRAVLRAQAIYNDESSPEPPETATSGGKRGRKPGESDNDDYRPYKRSK